MTDDVTIKIKNSITTVMLNDPDRRNPISRGVKERLIEFLSEAPDRDVRCVTFEGAGSAFSSGGDIDSMKERRELWGDPAFREVLREELRLANRLIEAVYTLPIPTIAKLDGPAVGSGAALALACDVRLASENASIGFGFRHVGLSVDSGVSYLLPRVVGLSNAKDLVLTGKRLDADEAFDLGLVDRLYGKSEFEERADEYVKTVAKGPTIALGHITQLLNRSFETDLQSALENEAVAQEIAANTEDHAEGVDAFLERRESTFRGR